MLLNSLFDSNLNVGRKCSVSLSLKWSKLLNCPIPRLSKSPHSETRLKLFQTDLMCSSLHASAPECSPGSRKVAIMRRALRCFESHLLILCKQRGMIWRLKVLASCSTSRFGRNEISSTINSLESASNDMRAKTLLECKSARALVSVDRPSVERLLNFLLLHDLKV